MSRYQRLMAVSFVVVLVVLGSETLRHRPAHAGERPARTTDVELRVLATAQGQGEITACG